MTDSGSNTDPAVRTRSVRTTRLLGLLVVAMAVVYGLAFPLLTQQFGTTARVFSLVFILMAAWLWGMVWGIAFALFNTAFALTMSHIQGLPLPGGPIGPLTSLTLAILVGRLRDVSWRLRQEVDDHRHSEAELAKFRDRLQDIVTERTKELALTNHQLRQEIAERRQAEENLQVSKEKYRLLAENITDNIWIMSLSDLKFTYVSPSVLNMHGYTSEEALEIKLVDLITPASLETALKMLEEELAADAAGADPSRSRTLELEQVRKDGAAFWTEVCIRFIRDAQGRPEGMLGVTRDITERKRLQAQLQQAHKMEAVGILAGGVAHDFNNLLQVINGYAELLLADKPNNSPDHRGLSSILKASARAGKLVQQLLLYSRKAETEHLPLNLNQEVEEALRILERTIPKMIDIEIQTPNPVWTISADHVQLEQVLLNLGNNAADAMPDGGRLTFATENVILDDDFCQGHLGARPGPHVLLTVSDTGLGMSPETLDHVFEPFFTTKDIGKGTGLGLASVFGIVSSHGGYIHCDSQEGRGATFKVYFPACDCNQEPLQIEPAFKMGPPRGNGETILLVDDEQDIRDFASQALQIHGYQVVTAASGEQALDIIAGGTQADLVVLDLGMPGMGGRKCLQELLIRQPSAKVLIASGYSAPSQTQGADLDGAVGFIGKPYGVIDLLGMVHQTLGQGPKIESLSGAQNRAGR